MKFGLTNEELKYVIKTAVMPLKENGARVFCYGSRARGTHNKFSDLDLMVESEKDLQNEISLISEKMKNSNFQYKVDLVDFKYFADSYKKNYQDEKIEI